MPKGKALQRSIKKGNNRTSAQNQTEIDFLEAADEQEKGGNKWKAGDSNKATRFFTRALDHYNEGLQKFPDSFDLAYNKAHLTFEIVQDARIAPLFGSRADILNETLQAHRYALRLNQGNPDILFNTAQVLTSLADEMEDVASTEHKQNVIQLLREAVELFGACLERQEMLLSELQASIADSAASQELTQTTSTEVTDSSPQSPAEQWATVEEPVTASVVLDTAVALIYCLEGLLAASVPAESSTLAAITELALPLIHTKIPAYVSLIPENVPEQEREVVHVPTLSISSNSAATFSSSQRERKPRNPRFESRMESGLAIASFQVSLAEAEYRSSLSTFETFSARVKETFDPILNERNISAKTLAAHDITPEDIEAVVAYAEAYNNAIGPAQAEMQRPMTSQQTEAILSDLIRADELLAFTLTTAEAARMVVSPLKRAQTYTLRADLALRKSKIMRLANRDGHGAASSLREAEELYRLAADQANKVTSDDIVKDGSVNLEELKRETVFKGLLAAAITTMEFQQFRVSVEHVLGVENAVEMLRDVAQEGLLDIELADSFAEAVSS